MFLDIKRLFNKGEKTKPIAPAQRAKTNVCDDVRALDTAIAIFHKNGFHNTFLESINKKDAPLWQGFRTACTAFARLHKGEGPSFDDPILVQYDIYGRACAMGTLPMTIGRSTGSYPLRHFVLLTQINTPHPTTLCCPLADFLEGYKKTSKLSEAFASAVPNTPLPASSSPQHKRPQP